MLYTHSPALVQYTTHFHLNRFTAQKEYVMRCSVCLDARDIIILTKTTCLKVILGDHFG